MSTICLRFDRMPSPMLGFVRAAFAGGPGIGDGRTIPPLEAKLSGIRADSAHVDRYARLCGYADHSDVLPTTYPHVLAAPLHLAVLTHRAFPLRLLGLVHIRNYVRQQRPLLRNEALDISVTVAGHRNVAKGFEFDLRTQVTDAGGTEVWYSSSTNLFRTSGNKRSDTPWEPPRLDRYRHADDWMLPANLGRRYGWAAGDINPIHLHPLSARLFGFPRAIAHGMWSFAHCVATLQGEHPPEQVVAAAEFRRPLLLPGKARLYSLTHDDGTDYALTSPDGGIFHLTGRLNR